MCTVASFGSPASADVANVVSNRITRIERAMSPQSSGNSPGPHFRPPQVGCFEGGVVTTSGDCFGGVTGIAGGPPGFATTSGDLIDGCFFTGLSLGGLITAVTGSGVRVTSCLP